MQDTGKRACGKYHDRKRHIQHAYYVVYTNFPGEIVYEDDYQIVVKVDENVVIEDVQVSWSPEDLQKKLQ